MSMWFISARAEPTVLSNRNSSKLRAKSYAYSKRQPMRARSQPAVFCCMRMFRRQPEHEWPQAVSMFSADTQYKEACAKRGFFRLRKTSLSIANCRDRIVECNLNEDIRSIYMSAFGKIFGSHSDHEIKRVLPLVDKIESLRPDMQKLSDAELRGKTDEFKERLGKGETLDDLLPEAFAVNREAAKRVLGMEHFRVQLIGGIILHQGRISEMKTGEGKTLVATLPAYLNALEGRGVQIVTVNDYLAHRDADWMGKVHEFLGLKVGCVLQPMKPDERREAYNCDITYITNNELGFDYLRDNMVIYKEQLVQRDLHYCIIDEVDSVLIDEARTPLIISGMSGKSTDRKSVV